MTHVVGTDDGVGYGVEGISATSSGVIGVHGTLPGAFESAAVVGLSTTGTGVSGSSSGGVGVAAFSAANYGVSAQSQSSQHAAVFGFNNGGAPGVRGESQLSEGVHGISHAKVAGVAGFNDSAGGPNAVGVWGESQNWEGVHGISHAKVAGVAGFNDSAGGPNAVGVWGESQHWEGVHGISHGAAAGVAGFNDAPQGAAQSGLWGESQNGEGVHGVTHSPSAAAITGIGAPGGLAGFFQGHVTCTGNHTCMGDMILSGADCAEHFDIASRDEVEAGTVMVINQEGILEPCSSAYDKRVAGVISGAGAYKPGIVLDKQQSDGNRQPIALLGKVYCKVDASFGPVDIGDLLTTSPTPGHAMKASDPSRAFGAVIGKALRPLAAGQSLIPILIALQ
jgi:hypothetical protein